MLSPRSKRNLHRIIPYGVIWLLVGWILLFVQEAATLNQNLNPTSAITLTPEVFVFASIAVTLVGLSVGTVEVLWLGHLFKRRSFTQKILYKVAFYTFFLLLIMIVIYPMAAGLELDLSPLHPEVLKKLSNFFVSIDFASTCISLAFSLFLSLFYSEISENLGHAVLMNFFTGKYHRPTEEERIFLFSDMKSSTSIAERLGHIRYFELLREYYSDFSDAIISHSGEIYQYVGDEIIISWKYPDGIGKGHCIGCFLAMKEDLKKRADWYTENFGVAPTFKAAMHIGKVTTGEIGALKKEIIFTGDVLNTTARIQGLCNSFATDLLLSGDLVKRLPPMAHIGFKAVGRHRLKGKEEGMELFMPIYK
ncbi:adenylate/guanylate cyclase domain-containing protein [Pseudozobellia thermophila]|uniref:Adenylate cyclase n=1 Tax=Pseudozobellia thermophila TaxID=192903 RepID=A0A1M6IS03_9FLAO|nr:adenylate/guanylate cyclase domain-containing protein [Pseudozobellia thermophila]SHJ37246.1 adenylate cyclase [Pseudozobellia thermophila]